jgi:hypothetical protein
MSNSQVVTQISRQDPAIESYRLGLLQAVKQFTDQQIAGGVTPPAYQVAALGPEGQLMSAAEQAALSQSVGGVGAYAPFLQGGLNVLGLGQQAAGQFGLPGLQQGIATAQQAQPFLQRAGTLAETTRDEPYMYRAAAQAGLGEATRLGTGLGLAGIEQLVSPESAYSFMNPFETAAIQQTMGDIDRQGQLARQNIAARAVGQGAFGGSRQAVAEQELQRNVLEQQARTAAQMRAAGFESAAQRAAQTGQSAAQLGLGLGQLGQAGAQAQGQLGLQFGQLGQQDVSLLANLAAQQQALGQGIGGLAAQYGTLGTQLGQLGVQQAGLGEMATNLRGQDIAQLLSTGAMQRGLEQSVLDARRMTETARQAQPYQQYGFLSDIYAGVPTSQSTITASSVPQVSPFQTAIGLGIQGLSAAAGAQRAGLI